MSNLKKLKETVDHMIAEGGKDWETVPVAYALWVADDVKSVANFNDEDATELTDAEISGVLDEVYHAQDGEYGINWETINCAVRECLSNR